MARGYTDALKVGDYLGRTLSVQEYAQATQLVDAVETYIDRRTGRAWLNGTTVTDELHVIAGDYIYLTQRPVVAITSLEVRASEIYVDTLVPAADYVLVDPANGLLAMPWAYRGYRARITYTHLGPPLPADLALAATQLGAHWLAPHIAGGSVSAATIDPATSGIKRYSVGQDLTVEYFDSAVTSTSNTTSSAHVEVPADIRIMIDSYRSRARVFA